MTAVSPVDWCISSMRLTYVSVEFENSRIEILNRQTQITYLSVTALTIIINCLSVCHTSEWRPACLWSQIGETKCDVPTSTLPSVPGQRNRHELVQPTHRHSANKTGSHAMHLGRRSINLLLFSYMPWLKIQDQANNGPNHRLHHTLQIWAGILLVRGGWIGVNC